MEAELHIVQFSRLRSQPLDVTTRFRNGSETNNNNAGFTLDLVRNFHSFSLLVMIATGNYHNDLFHTGARADA